MSRIRSIHPGLFTDEAFVVLSPMARIFFMGLWTECDDMGSFEWSPLKLKMRLLPADNVDANELLAEIERERGILRYEINGKSYGAVRNFCQYQRPKKATSQHPQTDQVRAWVNTEARSTRGGGEVVGNQLPTGGGKPRQMEDGGDNGKEELEAKASCPSDDEQSLRPEHVMEKWNDLAPAIGKPRIITLTPERRQAVKARITQHPIDDFVAVFANIRASPFLQNYRGMGFDWTMKKGNFQKILEGNYNG